MTDYQDAKVMEKFGPGINGLVPDTYVVDHNAAKEQMPPILLFALEREGIKPEDVQSFEVTASSSGQSTRMLVTLKDQRIVRLRVWADELRKP